MHRSFTFILPTNMVDVTVACEKLTTNMNILAKQVYGEDGLTLIVL